MNECCFFIKRNNFISVSGEIFTTVYMRQPDMKLTAGVTSLRSFSQKSNFILGDKKYHLNTTRNESYEREHLRIRLFHQNKNDVLLLNERFSSTSRKTKFHFISPAVKSSVNRTSFMVDWNLISGRFHFGSYVKVPFTLKIIDDLLLLRLLTTISDYCFDSTYCLGNHNLIICLRVQFFCFVVLEE